MIGALLIGAGLTLIGAGATGEVIAKVKSKKGIEPLEECPKLNEESLDRTSKCQERTMKLMALCGSLGILDADKGDWLKVIDYKLTKNYSQLTLKISDTICLNSFTKHIDALKEKLNKKFLEVYWENGKLYLRARHNDIPLVPYQFTRCPKHLIPLGVDIEDQIVYVDVSHEAHMLLCGATGSGKSRMAHSLINHIIHNNQADLYLIDLKRGLELGIYKDTTLTKAYATTLKDVDQVIAAFEMESDKRYELLQKEGYNDYNDYIKDHPKSNLKRAFLIIDEFADITRNKKDDMIERITELAAKTRACGMHIWIMSQRPTNDFINASTKANLSCIVGLKTINEHNSRLIIDETGLEQLNRAEAIGIVSSTKVFFRAFKFNMEIAKATAAQYAK